MIEIKDLLSGFKNILLSEEAKKEAIRSILLEETGLKIDKENIEIRNGVLYLNVKPIHKSEIFMKKEAIASKLKEALGRKGPSKIR